MKRWQALIVVAFLSCTTTPSRLDTVAGAWTFTGRLNGRDVSGTLRFEGANGTLSGAFTGPRGRTRALANVRFRGTALSFDLPAGRSSLHATATLENGVLRGTLTGDGHSAAWSAIRPGAAPRAKQEQAAALPNGSASKPNIIFILTDDMAATDVEAMPKLQALLGREGTAFPRYFVNDSLCCPSRASILRGQYVHNHRTLGNQPPEGGFEKFHRAGNEDSTIATWLQRAGYRTGLMGKYLNGYPRTVGATYVPPGWDQWDSPSRGGYAEFDYELNENGQLIPYGHAPGDFLVDVMARKSVTFIREAARAGQPFFLYLATFAPHQPATPAPRHASLFPEATAPRGAAFDEADVGDKPQFVRALPPLSAAQIAAIDTLHRQRIRSLQAVDDLIETLIGELRRSEQLERTYIVFSSDNGFHLGAHRMQLGKQTAYETDIRVPLVVRGPGVRAGVIRDELVTEIDLAPTFAEWAGLAAPSFVDGRSIAALLGAGAPPWRNAVLIEHYAGSTEPFRSTFEEGQRRGQRRIPTYHALRTTDTIYVEYESGERELYDLMRDPLELDNAFAHADRKRIDALSAQLAGLRSCRGEACRTADR